MAREGPDDVVHLFASVSLYDQIATGLTDALMPGPMRRSRAICRAN
jgi:hypothetical protein